MAKTERAWQTFDFYWSPEGRKLISIKTQYGLTAAKAEFKRKFPQHARYMGEVYYVENLGVIKAGN